MQYHTHLLIEATAIGIATVVFGLVVEKIFRQMQLKITPSKQMLLGLFSTGFAIHLAAEVGGLNRWYIKNGAVLKR